MEKRHRGLGWISILLIFMVISPPFFPTCTTGRTMKMAGDQYKKSSQADLKKELGSGRDYADKGLEEDSERWTKEVSYADYYERAALTNDVLSIQRGTDPGVMIYLLPLGHGHSKARSFHGRERRIESFSKLGDSIYFEQEGEVPGFTLFSHIKFT